MKAPYCPATAGSTRPASQASRPYMSQDAGCTIFCHNRGSHDIFSQVYLESVLCRHFKQNEGRSSSISEIYIALHAMEQANLMYPDAYFHVQLQTFLKLLDSAWTLLEPAVLTNWYQPVSAIHLWLGPLSMSRQSSVQSC